VAPPTLLWTVYQPDGKPSLVPESATVLAADALFADRGLNNSTRVREKSFLRCYLASATALLLTCNALIQTPSIAEQNPNPKMETKRNVVILMLVLSLLCSGNFCNADGFDSVHCGTDVRKALLGHKMSNEPTAALEERHKDLGLKDLGASEISDRLSAISWRICGEDYVLLEDKDVVRDVLKFPKHSKDSPQFTGSCQSNGQKVPGTAIGVLKNEPGVEMLSAVAAWKIDEKQIKFVELQTEGLRCSRDGIITADGGL
jgi:hypothetical protein